jgi:rod shape-determining protein MreC
MPTSRDDIGIAVRSALLQRGLKQKFSLFFLFSLAGLIFFFDSSHYKFFIKIRSYLNDGIYRISALATSPFKFVSFIGERSKAHFLIYNENKILKEELETLRSKEFQTDFLTSQNRSLQNIIIDSKDEMSINIIAKVILDKDSPFLKSIIVNKGTKSGVKKGMPVVDGNYLIGRTVEVNYLSSRVLLLNDLNSRIPVTIEPSNAQAIISGSGEDKPKLEYLPEIPLAIGSSVFTSGKDGIFLSGIPIGTTLLDKNITKVKLFSDPNQLSFVKIIILKKKRETQF